MIKNNNGTRCLPVGALPYTSEKSTTRMMVRLFENIPFLANLPAMSPNENVILRTLMNTPGMSLKDKRLIYDDETPNLKQKLFILDAAFNKMDEDLLAPFAFKSVFLSKYFQILERVQPKYTVINLIGPFSLALYTTDLEGTMLITDKYYRKVIIQAVCVKALWVINQIKQISPETKPIIVFEEPMLYKVGNITRVNEEVTREVIINMFSKVVSKIHEAHSKVCIQCFEKCDWKIPIDAGVDIISFDAYNNPNNLNIISDSVSSFLSRGGRINWAIVPIMNENIVKSLSIESVYDRFIKTINGLVKSGVNEKLVYNSALVSIQGNVNRLPLIFAEKAMILATQLARRIPLKLQ